MSATTATDLRGGAAPAAPVARRRPGIRNVYAWELRKLRAQKRTYLGLGSAAAVPIIFVAALVIGGGDVNGVPFGAYIKQTGLAVPPVLLLFSSIWLLPLIVSLVAGDIVANEDGNGTLKTILTRSADRHQIWIAKMLAAFTYTLASLVVFAGVGLLLGSIFYGLHPLTSLSGTLIPVGRALLLMLAALAAYSLPLFGLASIALMLSTVTRNSAGAVVGALMVSLIMQVLGVISVLHVIHPYLLTTQFNAWQGLLREPADWAPIVRAVWVSACYGLPALAVGLVHFMRRDVTGG